MNRIEAVRCPNCGRYGERYYLSDRNLVRTQCSECDYLLVTCSLTGKVIEAYAPGLDTGAFTFRRQVAS